MSEWSISRLAREAGVAPSSIRYYERFGVLPSPPRRSGRRLYEPAALHRLAVVIRAQACGFTLEEIRRLFLGFRPAIRASARWQALSQRKLDELEAQRVALEGMRDLLLSIRRRCDCATLEECGERIVRSGGISKGRRGPETGARPSRAAGPRGRPHG